MRVLHFLSNEAGDGPQQTVAVMIGVSGLTSSLLLALTNLGAEQAAAAGGIQIALLVAYLIALAILFEARRFALVQSALAFETALLRFRVRLLDKLRRQEPRALEAQPGNESQAAVADHISVLSHSVMSLGPMAEALVILVAIGLYIAWLSPASLVAILAVYAVTTPIYWVRFLASRDRLSHAGALDRRFVTAAQACLHSVRSRPFDQRASDALFADLRRTSATALAPLRAGAERQMNDAIFATSSFYLALLAVGFLTPALVPELGSTMQQVVAALLFTIAPLAQLVNGTPILARAEAALRALYAAEARLDAGLQRPVASQAPSPPAGFETIELSGAVFHAVGHDGQAPFVVGPVDLVLYPGERVLVVGANGSGKSTLLRGLTGLYPPHCGTIRRDGRPVTDAERPAYRGLFSSVFTDREQPLGLAALSEQEAVALTHFAPASCRRFQTDRPGSSTPDHALSRSERTRRAVARALLSQRPITVFDDILAGQDIDFRRCFYEEILAALSRAGRTAVLVSHDEGFDQTADRVLEVCRGAVVERTRAPSSEAPDP